MKTLYCGGDSWTQGDELGLPYREAITEKYEFENSYPFHLSQLLNSTMLVNDGQGGTSNSRIFRRAINFIRDYSKKSNSSELLVVVCWTTIDRDEIPIDVELTTEKQKEMIRQDQDTPSWIPIRKSFTAWLKTPNSTDIDSSNGAVSWWIPYQAHGISEPNHSEVFKLDNNTKLNLQNLYKNYLTSHGDKSRIDIQYNRMWQLKQICKSLDVKLLQCWALEHPGFTLYGGQPVITKSYQDELGYLMIPFIEFCRDNNHEFFPGGHCKEPGHEAWARHLYENISNTLL